MTPVDDSLDLRIAACTHPNAIALITPSGSYTYADLAERVERKLASWPDDSIVAVVCHPNVDGFVNFYAALARGGPTLLIHPRWSQQQVEHHLAQVGAQCLIDGSDIKRLIPGPAPRLHPEALLLLTTSGSSGSPKVVQHSRSSLVAAAQISGKNLVLDEYDRWLLSIPFSHIGGVSILVRCLCARLPIVSRFGSFFDLVFLHDLDKQRASLYSLVPTQLYDLVQAKVRNPEIASWARYLLVGGAPASLPLRKAAYAARLPVLYTYGMTEAGSQISTQRPGSERMEPSECDVGVPLDGCEVRIDEYERIHICGPNMMLGYVGAARHAEGAVGCASNGRSWFATSDRGKFLADGRLMILGRVDDVIISGGENVHPQQVEDQLGRCPLVQEVAVFGLPDVRWGQRIIALWVCNEAETKLSEMEAQLAQFARDHLPGYAVPKEYVRVQKLPRIGISKLDRKSLPSAYQAALPQH